MTEHDSERPSGRSLVCGSRILTLDRPRVMGILNVTPDSFSDGGRFHRPEDAVARAIALVAAGADIIDIGGESTRPGAAVVPLQQELDRVVPVIEAVAAECDVVVSVDTSQPEVMCAAVAAGAALINDVRALGEPGALEAAARLGVPVCLMHMQGTPATMQADPRYRDVVAEVLDFLLARRAAALAGGVAADAVLFDPGFGFGKRRVHNVALLQGLGRLAAKAPVVAGLSRKRLVADLLGDSAADRMVGSVTAALAAIVHGSAIVRVHDVAETVQALAVWCGLHEQT